MHRRAAPRASSVVLPRLSPGPVDPAALGAAERLDPRLAADVEVARVHLIPREDEALRPAGDALARSHGRVEVGGELLSVWPGSRAK